MSRPNVGIEISSMVLLKFASNSNEWRIVRTKLQTVPETLTHRTELNEMTAVTLGVLQVQFLQ